jgi:hypothetical protein
MTMMTITHAARKSGVALVCANVLFFMIVITTARVPEGRYREVIRDAFASGDLVLNDYPRFDARRGAHQWADCLYLHMMISGDRHLMKATAGPLVLVPDDAWGELCLALSHAVTEPAVDAPPYRYTRYWHGGLSVSKLLLSVFDLATLRVLLRALIYASLLLLPLSAALSGTRLTVTAAWIGLTGMLFWGVAHFGQSIAHGYADLFAVSALGFLLAVAPRVHESTSLMICSLAGAGAVFFDLMMGAIPVLAGTLLTLSWCYQRDRLRRSPGASMKGTLAVMLFLAIGGAAAVLVKQGIAVAVLGPSSISSFAGRLAHYASRESSAVLAPLHAVLGHANQMTYANDLLGRILVWGGFAAWLTAIALVTRSKQRDAAADLGAFAAGAAVPIAWLLILHTHTVQHPWLMSRILFLPITLGFAAASWQLLRNRQGMGPLLRGRQPT